MAVVVKGGLVLLGDLPEGGGGLVFMLICCSTDFCSKEGRMSNARGEKSKKRSACGCGLQAHDAFSQISENLIHHLPHRGCALEL